MEDAPVDRTLSGRYGSVVWVANCRAPEVLASTRYTAIIPAKELGGRVAVFYSPMNPDEFLDREDPSVLILTKHFENSLLDLAKSASRRGIPIITNLCDWHFDNQERRPIDHELCRLANVVMAPCETMCSAIWTQFGIEARLIEEPVELPPDKARFQPSNPLRIFWCGHSSNLDTLGPGLEQLARVRCGGLQLHLMSNRPPPPWVVENQNWQSPITAKFTPFSLHGQIEGLRQCHLAIIPSLKTNDKLVKPPGRLVNIIRTGRFAVVHPLPSYVPLGDYCWCGEDIGEGVTFALGNPKECKDRLIRGQKFVEDNFSPRVVGEKIASLIDSLL
ncbi:MAG: hypothetical protein R3229_09160 [Alphaproteobacteria bacterium]|nr:hypothetical protein [Alphaproteobacteria bacterium]